MVLFVDFDQIEEAEYAQSPLVERNDSLAKDHGDCVTLHEGGDVGNRSQVVAESVFPLFAPFLQVEFIRRLEDDLERLAEAFAAVGRVAQHREEVAEFPRARDAEFVPVDKRVFNGFKRFQGDRGRSIFEERRVDQLNKDFTVVGERDDARTKFLLQMLVEAFVSVARRRSHKYFLLRKSKLVKRSEYPVRSDPSRRRRRLRPRRTCGALFRESRSHAPDSSLPRQPRR